MASLDIYDFNANLLDTATLPGSGDDLAVDFDGDCFWVFYGDILYQLRPRSGTTFTLDTVATVDVKANTRPAASILYEPKGVVIGATHGYVHYEYSEPLPTVPPTVETGQELFRFNKSTLDGFEKETVPQIQSSSNPCIDMTMSPCGTYLYLTSRGSGGAATDARLYQIYINGTSGPRRVFQTGVLFALRWVTLACNDAYFFASSRVDGLVVGDWDHRNLDNVGSLQSGTTSICVGRTGGLALSGTISAMKWSSGFIAGVRL